MKAICSAFQVDEQHSSRIYIMYAPNCDQKKAVPPNHKSSFYFAPPKQLQTGSIPERVKRKLVLFYCLTIIAFA